MQTELKQAGNLLKPDGHLEQIGWARQPILDCNLEQANFYALKAMQGIRIKRWDYYAIFTPEMFFSATIADLGYAGNIFVYIIDFTKNEIQEEGLVIPFGKGIRLPRNSMEGESHFSNGKAKITFNAERDQRKIRMAWPGFRGGEGLEADITLACPPTYESMNIVIPIGEKRFYYNRKINCMAATGTITRGKQATVLDPGNCLGSLDWGRGVWEYKSFWNWASASGYLPNGKTIGLNLGCGFGDLSKAGENAIIMEHTIHKIGRVKFDYESGKYMNPWRFKDEEGRMELVFTPFLDRTAKTNLAIVTSEVHQMFGRYNGSVVLDDGTAIEIRDLVGFAEEHQAQW